MAGRQLIHMIARREGIGELLARGSRQFGRAFDAEEEAVQVNGLEVAYHDPRGVSGMALSYATSPRGACHNQSDYLIVDWGHTQERLGITYYDRHAFAEKSANVAQHQNWRTFYNSLVMCTFANVDPQMQVDLVNAACGLDWTLEDMMKAGERAWNLKRAINNRIGLTAANDKLPKALLEPYGDGGSAGYIPDLKGMLTEYSKARGWDAETGKPLDRNDINADDMDVYIDRLFTQKFGDNPSGATYLLKRQIRKHMRDLITKYYPSIMEQNSLIFLGIEEDLKIIKHAFRLRGRLDSIEQRGRK